MMEILIELLNFLIVNLWTIALVIACIYFATDVLDFGFFSMRKMPYKYPMRMSVAFLAATSLFQLGFAFVGIRFSLLDWVHKFFEFISVWLIVLNCRKSKPYGTHSR